MGLNRSIMSIAAGILAGLMFAQCDGYGGGNPSPPPAPMPAPVTSESTLCGTGPDGLIYCRVPATP